MIAVMSLWTEPTRVDLTRAGLLICTAAAHAARRHFAHTELVSDLLGIQVADALGWKFTSYAMALENVIPQELRHIWALGKIEAQRIQTKPHVHLDLDLVLYAPLPPRVLNARVAVQSKDRPSYYTSSSTQAVMDLCRVPRFIVPFNTAVSLWNDLGFRNEYCAEVMHRARLYGALHKNGTVLSTVLEQALLAEMAREAGVPVEECIGIPLFGKVSDTTDIRFTHYWAHSKKNPKWINACEQRFADDYPEEFIRFNRGIQMLKERNLLNG